MPSKHLVDPEIAPLVEQFPGFAFDLATLDATRAMMLEMGQANRPPPPEVAVAERFIPGPPGAPDVRVVVSAPRTREKAGPGILHIHGGGYVMGAAEMTLATDAAYAAALGAVVVSVDYRLAPETRTPDPSRTAMRRWRGCTPRRPCWAWTPRGSP